MTNLFKRLVMRLLGKKEEAKPEKIRFRVKNGKLVSAYYPAHIVDDHLKHAAARQYVACYEIELNGSPFLKGLGA